MNRLFRGQGLIFSEYFGYISECQEQNIEPCPKKLKKLKSKEQKKLEEISSLMESFAAKRLNRDVIK